MDYLSSNTATDISPETFSS